jgi:hypothetical protein
VQRSDFRLGCPMKVLLESLPPPCQFPAWRYRPRCRCDWQVTEEIGAGSDVSLASGNSTRDCSPLFVGLAVQLRLCSASIVCRLTPAQRRGPSARPGALCILCLARSRTRGRSIPSARPARRASCPPTSASTLPRPPVAATVRVRRERSCDGVV